MINKEMGCLKLAHIELETSFLRCVYCSFEHQKSDVNRYDYGARFYDPQIGRWHVQDPLAENYFTQSTYHFSGNNPINFLDLNGMNYNPIYGFDGAFLGTDNKGLKGDPIIMDKDDFDQGMSHKEALEKGVTASTFAAVVSSVPLLSSLSMALQPTFDKIESHASNLSSRPDYDGVMSYSDLLDWGRENGNSPVFLDASKIDLGNISVSDFPGVGEGRRINTVGRGTPLDTFGPWGKNYMRLMSADGLVKLSSDDFDYRQHDLGKAWDEGVGTFLYESLVRHPAIGVLQKLHRIDNDFGFTMHPYGLARIKK